MIHAMVTIRAPIARDKIEDALRLMRLLGNPARSGAAAALDRLEGDEGVHFASLHAIPPGDPGKSAGHLVLEFSADGREDEAIARIAERIGDDLRGVFGLAEDWSAGNLAAYLRAHKVRLGQGLTGQAGLAFAGTPGMSVGRIRQEARLAEHVSALVGGQAGAVSALGRLERVRADLRANGAYKWALDPPTSLPLGNSIPLLRQIWPIVASFARTFLWPLIIPLVVVLGFGLPGVVHTFQDIAVANATLPQEAWSTLVASWSALSWLMGVTCAFAVVVFLLIGGLYLSLRRKEEADWLNQSAPKREVLRSIVENENRYAQNHMVSVTALKPGLTRMATTRLVFWIIGQLVGRSFRPGYLSGIGTIHFARWVTLPGSRDFVFFSNYGGSWESYLEDFITKAHDGLTAIWSNTVGFPRARNLIEGGAADGERFKRYARQSMLPTPFWYSAYPTLTTANIRANAAIRCGLAVAMTDEEAVGWLALFGSATRPAAKLESDQIQSLVFGGLGFMPHGELLLIDLDSHTPATRGWLKEIRPQIAFDDGRRLKRKAVLTVALGPGALAKAGLPSDAVASFPPAYLDGMTGPGRSRILGDDPDDPEHPWWWRPAGSYDVALLVYGIDEASTVALTKTVKGVTEAYGHAVSRTIPLCAIRPTPSERLEPFGFADGISQPVIRGTYRGLRTADPIHLVEAGEFILGYPDNRGNLPPGPTLRALDDPDNRLPIRCDNTAGFGSNVVDLPREIGRNGSFLVIRQLEQDRDAFWDYCEREAGRLQERLGEPYLIDQEFIGAKMVGRWPDGSSLARNPYRSFTCSDDREKHATRRPATNPADRTAIAPPAGGDPLDNDFLFGTEDPQGLRCPFGAHIRRANPRDSLAPGSQDQIDISNRHRIIRVGRAYAPQGAEKSGLLFMCLNGDIERQFEFVQQTWLNSETFHGLSGERDPLASNRAGCPNGFTIPTRDGPLRLAAMSRFVTPRGGGYFFLPGKKLLEFLGE